MTTLFISDLHLSDAEPALVSRFKRFIEEEASKAEALYILGDLFEAWVGDDDTSMAAQTVAASLTALSQQGTKVYYLHGNRDFLLGEDYAAQCHMEILPDPCIIQCNDESVLLTHGDLLCTDDTHYQRFRNIVHQNWIQKCFLMLPQSFRQKVADKLRARSMDAGQQKTPEMMDVNEGEVENWFIVHDVNVMVHGHTHRPQHHDYGANHRYVLGAWDVLPIVLKYENGAFSQETLD